jgi:hypothetical protein
LLSVFALAALAMLSAVLALALLREVRLRRALQSLLFRLLTALRRNRSEPDPQASQVADSVDNSDGGL